MIGLGAPWVGLGALGAPWNFDEGKAKVACPFFAQDRGTPETTKAVGGFLLFSNNA